MRLTMQDKNEFLKAAVKAPDRESLARWLVSVVDAIDAAEREGGKADATVACPPFVLPAANGHGITANGAPARRWEDTLLT